MAIIQGTYLSDALKRSITYHVYLPNDTADEMKTEYYERPAKVLYLLIGYSGASIDWVTGSLIFGAAQKYNVTVVMVSGENSFYRGGTCCSSRHSRHSRCFAEIS